MKIAVAICDFYNTLVEHEALFLQVSTTSQNEMIKLVKSEHAGRKVKRRLCLQGLTFFARFE